MDGGKLALGTVAAGAIAAAMVNRRQGSAERAPCNPLVLTTQGFPWPADYELYHATTAMRAIVADRFKVRSQLRRQAGRIEHATGGGTDSAVSFTLDPRVAESILVGLITIRALVRRELSLAELIRRYKRECPKGWRELTKARPWMASPREIRFIDEGWFEVSSHTGVKSDAAMCFVLPEGAIPISDPWKGADGRDLVCRYRFPFERRRELTWQYPESLVRLERSHAGNEAAIEAYKAMLAFAQGEFECYDPLFFLTEGEGIGRLAMDDLGMIVARTTVPRICLDGKDAIRLGYLTREEIGYASYDLNDWKNEAEWCVQHDGKCGAPPSFKRARGFRPGSKIGPWSVSKREPKPTARSTLTYLPPMAELRVWNPKAIQIVRSVDAETLLADAGLTGRVTRPWFEYELAKPLPGELVRQCRAAGQYRRHSQQRRAKKQRQDSVKAIRRRGWVQAEKVEAQFAGGFKPGGLRVPPGNPIWNPPAEGDEQRFEIKTYGPWGIVSSIRGLVIDGRDRVYGMRTMHNPKETGYQMEGWVPVKGKKRRAFTSVADFLREDGSVIKVAVLHITTLSQPED